jgi:hypothetical protein
MMEHEIFVREHDEMLAKWVQQDAELKGLRAKSQASHAQLHELKHLREQLEEFVTLQQTV